MFQAQFWKLQIVCPKKASWAVISLQTWWVTLGTWRPRTSPRTFTPPGSLLPCELYLPPGNNPFFKVSLRIIIKSWQSQRACNDVASWPFLPAHWSFLVFWEEAMLPALKNIACYSQRRAHIFQRKQWVSLMWSLIARPLVTCFMLWKEHCSALLFSHIKCVSSCILCAGNFKGVAWVTDFNSLWCHILVYHFYGLYMCIKEERYIKTLMY